MKTIKKSISVISIAAAAVLSMASAAEANFIRVKYFHFGLSKDDGRPTTPIIIVIHNGTRWVASSEWVVFRLGMNIKTRVWSYIDQVGFCVGGTCRSLLSDKWGKSVRHVEDDNFTREIRSNAMGSVSAFAAGICNRRMADPNGTTTIRYNIPAVINVYGHRLTDSSVATKRYTREFAGRIVCSNDPGFRSGKTAQRTKPKPRRTAPKFRVTSGTVKFYTDGKVHCPVRAYMRVAFKATGVGRVKFRVRRGYDGKIVYAKTLTTAHKQGLLYTASYRTASTVKKPHRAKYRLELADGRALTGWVPLRINCTKPPSRTKPQDRGKSGFTN